MRKLQVKELQTPTVRNQEPVSQMPQNDYVRGAEAFNI